MGCLTLNDKKLYDELDMAHKSLGGCPSVFDCYLALRGLKTLEARMKIHSKNAYIAATFLESHPLVEKVLYQGLESFPYKENVKKN